MYLVYSGGQYIYCYYDRPTLGPNDFETDYIPHPLPATWHETLKSAIVQRAPIFLYDSGESFHIVSPGAMTDLDTTSSDVNLNNSLKEYSAEFPGQSNILAITNAGLAGEHGWAFLNLDYLRPTYPAGAGPRAGTAALGSDFVDARGDELQQFGDSYSMELQPAYGNKVHGRWAYGSDGRLWFQYWVFYYRNPDPNGYFPGGGHEGDWEMVQLRLKPDLTPDLAAYAQHNTGQKCSWDSVERAGLAPAVYVADDSHASYFAPDRIPFPYSTYDDADGLGGGTFSGNLEQLTVTNPGWLWWPGEWGGISGPAFGGNAAKWDDPSGWADGWGC